MGDEEERIRRCVREELELNLVSRTRNLIRSAASSSVPESSKKTIFVIFLKTGDFASPYILLIMKIIIPVTLLRSSFLRYLNNLKV